MAQLTPIERLIHGLIAAIDADDLMPPERQETDRDDTHD